MEHRILAALHIGAAAYQIRLERLCRAESGGWKQSAPKTLKLELEINAEGFEELCVDGLLMYRQALMVSHDYVRACKDKAFKLDVLAHLEHYQGCAKRKADELIRNGRLDRNHVLALKKLANEIAAISHALHESAP